MDPSMDRLLSKNFPSVQVKATGETGAAHVLPEKTTTNWYVVLAVSVLAGLLGLLYHHILFKMGMRFSSMDAPVDVMRVR